jgi:DNA modification methylase
MNAIQNLSRQAEFVTKAKEFLAKCEDLGEIKDLHDKTEALRLYASQQKDGLEAQNQAAIVTVRAKRRIGEISKALDKSNPGSPKKDLSKTVLPKSKALADAGISPMVASNCEAIADIPEEEFEEEIQKTVEAGEEVTAKAMVKKGRIRKRKEKQRKNLERVPENNGKHTEDTWEIRQGDCLEVLGSLEARSTHLIVADPPYNIGIDYGKHYNDSMPSDEYDTFSIDWLNEAYRVLADDGTLWLIIGHDWARQVSLRAEEVGFHLKQPLIWYESFGVNYPRGYNLCSRMMYWFIKRHDRYAWNPHEVNRKSDRQEKYRDKRADPDGKTWDNVWGINTEIPRVSGTSKERMPDFPTQLPLALLRPIIGAHSNPDNLVIDPFSGSGTSGAACIELGRRFLGIELSEDFAALSRKRLLALSRNDENETK